MTNDKRKIKYSLVVHLKVVAAGLMMSVLVGCSGGDVEQVPAQSFTPSTQVQFVGEPYQRSCEPLQEDQPSSSYVAGAPLRPNSGDDVVISGEVLVHPTCQLVAGAVVEYWYAGPDGKYDDNQRRGRVITDSQGRFTFSVAEPGSYTDANGNMVREHIHLWVSGLGVLARGTAVQTNQQVVNVTATVATPTGV